MDFQLVFTKTGRGEALTKGVVVVTGGPGTGKTTTINLMIRCFERNTWILFLQHRLDVQRRE